MTIFTRNLPWKIITQRGEDSAGILCIHTGKTSVIKYISCCQGKTDLIYNQRASVICR